MLTGASSFTVGSLLPSYVTCRELNGTISHVQPLFYKESLYRNELGLFTVPKHWVVFFCANFWGKNAVW